MNNKDSIPNILNDVFNERKMSIIQTFQSIFEKILHDKKNQNDFLSHQEIEEFISTTMIKIFSSEQERFLSYLIYYISYLANITNLQDPNFASQFYIKKKEFDEKYDNDGQLQLILQTFRSRPIKSKFPDSVSFFALFLGFSFDATMIRSTLFELREIVNNTMKTVFEILKISKKEVFSFLKNSPYDSQKYEKLEQKTNLIQIEHEKELKSYQMTLHNYQIQIKEFKRNQTEMQQFRLSLESDLIQIISLIESLEKDDLGKSNPQFAINEIKKKSTQLLTKVNLTVSSETIKSNNESSLSLDLIQKLNEKDIIIKDLKNQLQNTISLIDENTSNNNNSLPLIKPNNPISSDAASKMSEIIKKSSIDLQNALNEKQILRKKLLQFQNLQSKYDDLEKERNELKEKLEEANLLKEKYYKKSKSLKQQMNENEIKFNSLMKHVSKLQKKVDQQKNRLMSAEKPLTESDFTNFKSSLLIEEINEKNNSLVEYENILTQLQKDNIRLLNENEMYRNTKTIDNKRISQLKENMKELTKQLDERDEQYKDLRNSLTNSNVSKIEEQLQISLTENQNLIIKFNKFIKKYQDLKINSQNILDENTQLKQQIDSLKSQTNENPKNENSTNENQKSENSQDEIVLELTNRIEKLEKRSISNDDFQLMAQRYIGLISPKNTIAETIDDLALNLEKSIKEIKEKTDQLSVSEEKNSQLQELITKLKEENQQISKYYKDLLLNIRSFIPCQDEQDLPKLINQINLENEQMKNILNNLKNLTKSENDQNLLKIVTNLVNEYKVLNEIKRITKSNNNQNAQNKIITLLKNNEILNNVKSKLKQTSNENIIDKINKLIQDSDNFLDFKSKLTQNTNLTLSERINSLLQDSSELKEVKAKFLVDSQETESLLQKIESILHDLEDLNIIKSKLSVNQKEDLLQKIDIMIHDFEELNQVKLKLTTKSKEKNNENKDIIEIVDNLIEENSELYNIKNKLEQYLNSNQNLSETVDFLLENTKQLNDIKQQQTEITSSKLEISSENQDIINEMDKIKALLNQQSTSSIIDIIQNLVLESKQMTELKQKLYQKSKTTNDENIIIIIDKLVQESDEINEIKLLLNQNSNENSNLIEIINNLLHENNKYKELQLEYSQKSTDDVNLSQAVDDILHENDSNLKQTHSNFDQYSNLKDAISQTNNQLLQDLNEFEEIKSKLMVNQQVTLSERISILLENENELNAAKSKLSIDSTQSLSQKIDDMLNDKEELNQIKSKLLKEKVNENQNTIQIIDSLIEKNEKLNEVKNKLKQYLDSNKTITETIDYLLDNTKQFEKMKQTQNQQETKIISDKNIETPSENQEIVNEMKQIKIMLSQQSNKPIIDIIQNLIQESKELSEIKHRLNQNSNTTKNKNILQIIDSLLHESKIFTQIKLILNQNSNENSNLIEFINNLLQEKEKFESIKLKFSNEDISTSIDKLLQKSKDLEKIKLKLKLKSDDEILQNLNDLLNDRSKLSQLRSKLLLDSKESASKRISSLIHDSNKLKEVKTCLLQNSNESFSKRVKTLLNISKELKELKAKLLQGSTESFSKRVETLLNESKELKETKSRILQNSDESFQEKLSSLLDESDELNEIKLKLLHDSNDSLDKRISNLLKDSNELKEVKLKLVKNSNENLSQRIFQLLQESQDFREIKSRLLHDSNDSLSQRIDDLLGQSIELKYAKLKAFQDSNSNNNLSNKIEQLIQENKELIELKSKLLPNSSDNLLSTIDHLLKNNSEFNRVSTKLKQTSNSNDLYQIIDNFIQNKKELNEIKSKLLQFLGPNHTITQKVDFLLENDHEFKEMKSKLIQNSDESLQKRIEHLLKDCSNYNKIIAILRQNSNFQDPFQIIDCLIQNYNELNEIKSKLLRFSNPNESLIQKIDILLQNDQELKEMKSQLIQNSGEVLSQKIDNLLKENYDFNKLLSKLNKSSNLQDPFQIIDQLIQNNNELNEAKSKLVPFSNQNENFLQKIDHLLNDNNELDEIRSKLINFSNSKENIIQKINHLLQNYHELKQTKAKLIQDSSENLSQRVDRLLKESFEYRKLLTQLKQNSNTNDASQIIENFIQNDNELNEVKSKLNYSFDSSESLIQKIENLTQNNIEMNEIKSKLDQFSDSKENLLEKIDKLLQNNNELNEVKSKLNKFLDQKTSLIQKIEKLLLTHSQFTEIESKLNDFSDLDKSLDQKIVDLLSNNNELNEVKSKLDQFSNKKDSLLQKIENLLHDNKELKEAKSKLNKFSEKKSTFIQKIESLLHNNLKLTEIESKLNDFSDSNKELDQIIDDLLQNNEELSQVKSKLNQFSNPQESLLTKISILLRNNRELKEMKSRLQPNSDSSFSEQINSLTAKVDELEEAKSKLSDYSNENLAQGIDKLLLENKKLKEIQLKLESTSKSNSKISQRVDDLIENEQIITQLRESINFSSPDEITENFERLKEIAELFKCKDQKQLPKVCSNTIEKLKQISSIMNSDVNDLPDNILMIKEKAEKMEKVLTKLNDFIPFNNNEELLEKVKENISLISEIHELIPFKNYKQLISSLKSLIGFENEIEQIFQADNKKDVIQKAKEQTKEFHKICKNLQSISPSEDFRNIIPIIHKELNNYQEFVGKIQQIIPFDSGDDFLEILVQLIEENDFIKKKELHHKKVIHSFKESFQSSDINIQNLSQQISDIENNHLVFLNELANKMKISKNKVSENKILQKTYILQELADLIHNTLPEERNPINALNIILEKLQKNQKIFDEIHKIIEFDKNSNLPVLLKEKENQIKILRQVAEQLSLNSIEDIPKTIMKMIKRINQSPKSFKSMNDQHLKSSLIEILNLPQDTTNDDTIIKRVHKLSRYKDVTLSIQQILNINSIQDLPHAIKRLQENQKQRSSNTQQFSNQNFSQLRNSDLQQFQNKNSPQFINSDALQLQNPNIPQIQNRNTSILKNSEVSQIQDSNTNQFLNSNLPQFQNTNPSQLNNSNESQLNNSFASQLNHQSISQSLNQNKSTTQNPVLSQIQNPNTSQFQHQNTSTFQNSDISQIQNPNTSQFHNQDASQFLNSDIPQIQKSNTSTFQNSDATQIPNLDLSQFQSLFSQLTYIFENSIQQNDLTETIHQMKNENAQLSILINELQKSVKFDKSGEIASYIKGLIEKHPNETPQLENLLQQLNSLRKLDTIMNEIQKLKDNFASETEELKTKHQNFVNSITKVIGIKNIEDEIEIPPAIMKINNERNELQKKNATNLELIENLKLLINFNDDKDLISKIEKLTKLKKRVQKVKENIDGIKDIEDLPQFINDIQNELQNATKKYSSIVKQLTTLTGEKSETRSITEIANQIDDLKQLEEEIKRISSAKNLKEAMSKIREAINDKKVLEDLSNSLSMEIDYIPSELIKLQNQINSLKSQNSNLQDSIDSKDSELSKFKEKHLNFVSTLSSTLQINGKENEILKNIAELKSKNESLKKSNSSIQSKIIKILKIDNFSEFPEKVSDLVQEKNELQNELNEMNEKIRILQEELSCDDFSQIQEIFATLKKSKENSKDSHSKFVCQIGSALQNQPSSPKQFSIINESKLIDSVSKLRKNNSELSEKIKQTEKVFNSIKEMIQFNDFNDFPSAIQEIIVENETLIKASQMLNCDPKDIIQTIDIIKNSFKNQIHFYDQLAKILGISTYSTLNDSSENLLSDLENQSSDLLKQLEILNNSMKILECNNIKDFSSKISTIYDEKQSIEQKLQESEKKRTKLQNYFTNLKKSFSEVSNNEINNIPSEISNLKRENEKMKKTIFEMDSSFKQFKDQITDGLKMWDAQSAEEIVNAINSIKSLTESSQNNHEALIDKLRFIIKFNNEDQIPSIVEKIVNENNSMAAKLKRLSQIQSSIGETAIEDIPKTFSQLKSSLKNKNDQLEELIDKYQNLVNGIRQLIPFENENEIISKMSKLLNSANENKDQCNKITESVKNALDLQDDSDIIKAVKSMKKKLIKKEENEKNFDNFIKEIQKISNSKSISDIPSNIIKILNQINNYEKIINAIKQLLSVDEDKMISSIKKLLANNQTSKEQLKNYEEIFEKIKKIINFNSPDRIPSIIEQMNQDLEKSAKLTNSLSKILKSNSPDDFLQKIAQMKNDNKKAIFEFNTFISQISSILDSNQTNEDIIQKARSLQNNLSEVNDHYREISQNHENFVALIGRIIKNPDEETIPEKIQQIVEKLRSYEITNQNQLKIINSLKQILSVTSDDTLVKSVQKLLDSTQKIKSTMSMFNNNYQLSRDDSISELNTHIMSFESDFDSLRTKYDQIKSLFQVSDDNRLYDVLSTQKENYKQLVSQLLNITKVDKEKEIAGFVQQLINEHNLLLNELNESTGFKDPKQICLVVKQNKRKLSNAEKILGKNSMKMNNDNNDFENEIQNIKNIIDELKNITGTENENDLVSNISSVYSTLKDTRKNNSFFDDNEFNPKKAIKEAENRNRVLNELKSIAKINDIEEMKESMIQSRKIINELKNILGIENEMQIIPQIKELINSIPISKKSFKKSTIQQLKDSIDDNKRFFDSFSKELNTTDKDEGLSNLRKRLKFIEKLKKVTGINDEDEILQSINNIVQSSHSENEQYDFSDDTYNSENDNDSYSSKNHPKKRRLSSLKLASHKINSFQKLSDKIRKNSNLESDDDATERLLHLSEHVNNLKKITGIDDDDDLFTQIEEIIEANNNNGLDNFPNKIKQRRPSLIQMKDSIEQNKKLLNMIQSETKINDGDKATQKLIQAQKIVNELKKITGIENDSQIVPQIKAILNSIGNIQEGNPVSPRNKIEKMKKKIESNNKISEMLRNLTQTDSNEDAADQLNQWQEIIEDLRKLTHSEDDSQIIPQIHQIFSLFSNEHSFSNSDDSDAEFGNFNQSKAQKIKNSIEKDKDLLNKIKSITQTNSNKRNKNKNNEDEDLDLLNSIAANKKLADEMRKITEIDDDDDKIIRQIRSIFDSAYSDASIDSPRLGRKSKNQQQQKPASQAIAENQKLLNDLKRISKVNDPKQLKSIAELFSNLKEMTQIDEISELKEKLMKYSQIIKQLLEITGANDEDLLIEQIQSIFNIIGDNQNDDLYVNDDEGNFEQNLDLESLSSSEKLQLTIENNKNFVNEMMKLFKINNISRLREKIEQHFMIMSTLKKNLQLSNENQINPTVNNMIQILANLREISNVDSDKNIKTVLTRYTKLFDSISSILNISTGKDSDFLNLLKKLSSTEKRYKNIIEILSNHLSYPNEDDIPKLLNETLAQSRIDRNFVSHLFSLIEESNQVDITLDESLSTNIVQWFIKYLKEADEVLGDHKKFIDSAAVYGYKGNSAIEASDFLIECAITRRKHEIMESAHDEIESLRINTDTKIALIEKRNRELSEALKEARKTRKEIQQSCADIQKKSIEDEISFQNEISELNNTISNYKKSQEELVRLAAGKAYDKEILIKYLPKEDQIMLKIM